MKIVANGLRAAGLLLGILSLVSLFMFGGSLFLIGRQPSPPPSHPLDIQTYGLVGLLQNGAIGLGHALNFLGTLSLWLGVLMVVVSLVVLIVALLLFFIGRGVAAHAGWARIAAGFGAGVVFLASGSVLSSLPREAAAIDCAFMAVALYTLWVLGWRYARP